MVVLDAVQANKAVYAAYRASEPVDDALEGFQQQDCLNHAS